MQRCLLQRLVRKSVQLEKEFAGLDGTDVMALDRFLLRTALRPSKKDDAWGGRQTKPASATPETLHLLEAALTHPQGLTAAVKQQIANRPSPTPADISQAFQCLRFASALLDIFQTCRTPQPRSEDAGWNLGYVVRHSEGDRLCVIYAYDAVPDVSYLRPDRPCDFTEPHYHLVSSEGEFLYAPQSQLELVKSSAASFVEELRDQHWSTDGCAFVDGIFFVAVTADRLIPNADLWARFPDADGRTTSSGLGTLPLSDPEYGTVASPLTGSRTAVSAGEEQRPSAEKGSPQQQQQQQQQHGGEAEGKGVSQGRLLSFFSSFFRGSGGGGRGAVTPPRRRFR